MTTPPPILDYEPSQRPATAFNQLQKAFAIIEILLWAICVVGLIFRTQRWAGGSELIILSVSIVCLLFMFAPILVFGSQGWKRHLGSHAVGIALTFLTMALLFKIQRWEGASEMALVSVIPCVLAVLLTLIFGIINYKKQRSDPFYWKILFRLLLGLFLLFLLHI